MHPISHARTSFIQCSSHIDFYHNFHYTKEKIHYAYERSGNMQFSRNFMKSIIVEGNIGAGKSTFLTLLKDYLDVDIAYEPLDRWQDIGGENLLEKFYNNPERWSYTFQSFAFISRIMESERIANESTKSTLILERSVYSDRYCFAKNLYNMGKMNDLEWNMYQELFAWLVETYTKKPDGFIYLRTTPEVCYERLKKRNRSEESEVGLDYLTMVSNCHEEWLVKKEGIAQSLKDIPVLILDCNADFENNPQKLQDMLNKVQSFFGIQSKKIAYTKPAGCHQKCC